MVAMVATLLTLLVEAGVECGFTSLNFALTDGETTVATRYCDKWPAVPPPSLYFSFPTEEALASELCSNAAGAGPGDGTLNAAATAATPPGGAAEEGLKGDCYARRSARWAQNDAFLADAAATASSRVLLVASEPATEGTAGITWLAMPANSILVFTRAGGSKGGLVAPPVLTKLEDLLPTQLPGGTVPKVC
jgi:hypothetical protein